MLGINHDIASDKLAGIESEIELIIVVNAKIKAVRKIKKVAVAAAPSANRLVKYFKNKFTSEVKKPPNIKLSAAKKAFFIF